MRKTIKKRSSRNKKLWKPLALLALIGTALFGVYLGFLYVQLGRSFVQQSQFIPTRIYSDILRISQPQRRGFILEQLKNRGYEAKLAPESISFEMHQVNYPIYLIPENHPTIDAYGKKTILKFETPAADAPLQSIEVGGRATPDLYLEPELVATLSRPSQAGEQKSDQNEVRDVIKFDEIPNHVKTAIIAIEDQHFLEHKGFDPRGILRAVWVNIKTRSLAQGGSTITQQLVKNLTARRGKNFFKKINEVFLAILLELRFEKEQILERYLNEVYLGQVGNLEIHGVSEGAKHFFGKRLEELNLAEVALMAGFIRGPGFYSPYTHRARAIDRQKLVLKKMVETGQLAEGEAKEALKMPIRLAPAQTASNKAPYFTDYAKAELIRLLKDRVSEQEIPQAGFHVYTTLDVPLNAAAQKAVADGVAHLDKALKLPPGLKLEGALASVDHHNGFIRALVGGRNYAASTFNRILNMKRQVGSTFKPLVFLAAIKKRTDVHGVPYTPGYPMEDAPWTIEYDNGKQNWSPKNYEKEFLGWTSLRTALAHSVNTVTAKLGYEVGLSEIIQLAKGLGVESDLPAVPSLSLGVAELSPIELLRIYGTLANHGLQEELTVIRGITQDDGTGYARFVFHPKKILESTEADLMTDMLESVFTEGTARTARDLGYKNAAAGKTGTTSHHRDSWFAGYSPQLTTVVWVGLDEAPHLEELQEKGKKKTKLLLTGATSALPIWVNFMNTALLRQPPEGFPQNPDLVDVKLDRKSGKLATSDSPASDVISEKVIRGTEK
ncbi:PBP1A family penicillin-binding protein [Bdellovibrionota bacterium FG-2]